VALRTKKTIQASSPGVNLHQCTLMLEQSFQAFGNFADVASSANRKSHKVRFTIQSGVRLLRFFFHQMFGVRFVRRDHFVGELVWNVVVVRVFHRVRCTGLRLGREVRRVVEHFRERH